MYAQVAKQVYATDLKSVGREIMPVQVRLWAPLLLLNSFNGRTSAFQADDDGSIPLFSSIIKYSFGSQVVRQWSATPRSWVQISSKTPVCRCSLMVEHYLAKVTVGVRFSSLAPFGTLAQRQSKRLLTVRLQVRILHVPPLNAYLAQLAAQLTCNQ